jgi:hypothetical protein
VAHSSVSSGVACIATSKLKLQYAFGRVLQCACSSALDKIKGSRPAKACSPRRFRLSIDHILLLEAGTSSVGIICHNFPHFLSMFSPYDPEKGEGARPTAEETSRPAAITALSSVAVSLLGKKKADEEEDFSNRISPDELRERDPPIPARDPLAVFRRLTGIDSGLAHKRIKRLGLNRPAKNPGIYQHVVDEENAAKRKYLLFSRLINGCLGLQIIVAAALTALGAGDGPHAVVTVFGAINTVIAGFLTYLKGSGLPNRPKFFQSQWSELREYIEQRERDFGREGCKLNVDDVVSTVEGMYKEIRAEIEANTPDGYTSVTRGKKILHTPSDKPTEGTGGSKLVKSETTATTDTDGEKDEGGRMHDGLSDSWKSRQNDRNFSILS